jgi:hypothetical protein
LVTVTEALRAASGDLHEGLWYVAVGVQTRALAIL